MATAFQLFKDQPIGYAEFAECRKAINCLKCSLESLEILADLLHPTKSIPDSLTEKRYSISFLIEQTRLLIERINQGCMTDKEIKNKFIAIEGELTRFAPLLVHSIQDTV